MRCAHYAGFGALSRTAGSWIREVTHSYGAGLYFLGVLGLVAAALMPLVVTARFGGKGALRRGILVHDSATGAACLSRAMQ